MVQGGYQIINCEENEIGGEYNSAKVKIPFDIRKVKKPILISGLKFRGCTARDFFIKGIGCGDDPAYLLYEDINNVVFFGEKKYIQVTGELGITVENGSHDILNIGFNAEKVEEYYY